MNNMYTYKEVVKKISEYNTEPKWLLDYRLEGLRATKNLTPPEIERLDYSKWNLWSIPSVNNVKINEFKQENIDYSDILVIDFKEATMKYEELFKKIYEKSDFHNFNNFFNAFTTAFLTSGTFVYIPDNIKVDETIELSNRLDVYNKNDSNEKSLNHQVLIYAGSNSSIEIVEKYNKLSVNNAKSLNVHVQIIAATGANVQYFSLDHLHENTTAFIKRSGIVGQDATIDWALGVLNDGNVLEDIEVFLEGKGATSDIKAVSLCHGEQVQVVNANVVNYAPHTRGNIFQHGVAIDKSTITFNGIGNIKRDAKNSDAQQESRVLLLSDEARADANPILLIDEFEVEAGHAASVTRTNQEQLYYLMSRGLTEKEAEKLIIRGFLGIVLSEISKKEVREDLIHQIERKLALYEN